ncbi:uncharacterized protein LOC132200737 isoform X2 [Neocloeon triangulifer]|uniref:uncharacterized protein LOC132200737 isoform X2 n=1 Tax=Neocloeon triangulifer TaxID=2078957 RepID=UPI00286EE6FB|nr:uncharacterized protein LOC132200737 isoform X2 [Neocloeon triangulifer]
MSGLSATERLQKLFEVIESNTDDADDAFTLHVHELSAQLDLELTSSFSQSSSTPSQNLQPNESNALSCDPMSNQSLVILDHPPAKILQSMPANDEIFTLMPKSVAELIKENNALLKELLIQKIKELQNLNKAVMVSKNLNASYDAVISAKEEKIVALMKELEESRSNEMLLKTLLTFAEKLKQNGLLSSFYINKLSTWKEYLGENEDDNQNSFDVEEEEELPPVEDATTEPPEVVEQQVTSEVQMKDTGCDGNLVETPEAAPILTVKTLKDFMNLPVSENDGKDMEVPPILYDEAVAIEKNESKMLDTNSIHTEEQEIASSYSSKDQDDDRADQEGYMRNEEQVEAAENAEEAVDEENLSSEGSLLESYSSMNDSEIVYERSTDHDDSGEAITDEVEQGNLADGDEVKDKQSDEDEEATVGELQSHSIADEDAPAEVCKENTPVNGSKIEVSVDMPQVEAPIKNLIKEAATKDLVNEAPVFEKVTPVQDEDMETDADHEQQQLEMQANVDQMDADESSEASEESEKIQVDEEILEQGEGDKTELAVATQGESANLQGKPVDDLAERDPEIAQGPTDGTVSSRPEKDIEEEKRELRSGRNASQKRMEFQNVYLEENDANDYETFDNPPTKKRSHGRTNEKVSSSQRSQKKKAVEKAADGHEKVGLKANQYEVGAESKLTQSKVRKANNVTWKEGEPERLEENMSVEAQVPQEKKRKRTDGSLVKSSKKRRNNDGSMVKSPKKRMSDDGSTVKSPKKRRIGDGLMVKSPKKRRSGDGLMVKSPKKNLKRLSVSPEKQVPAGIMTLSPLKGPQNQTTSMFAALLAPETETCDFNQAIQLNKLVKDCQEEEQEEDNADDSATMSKKLFGSDSSPGESDDEIPVVEPPIKEKKKRQQGKKPSKLQQLKANMSKANPLLQKKRNK